MRANGPDGREWAVTRYPYPRRPLARWLPGSRWIVEAQAGDQRRRWMVASRRDAGALVDEVALSLRTGGDGPPGELEPGADPDVSEPARGPAPGTDH